MEDGLTVSTDEAGGGEDGSNEGEGKTHRVWEGRDGAGSGKYVDEERLCGRERNRMGDTSVRTSVYICGDHIHIVLNL